MKEPSEPKSEDCCDSGCSPCVFEIYEKQLMLFQKYLQTGETNISTNNGISELLYTSFNLIDKVPYGCLHFLLVFKLTHDGYNVWWKGGQHFLVKYATEKYSCTRAYTPIKLAKFNSKKYDFIVIVKKYDKGLVSNYLCSLEKGDVTLWRGPYGSYEIIPNKFNRIVMFAQGTGIAPFYSVINEILNNEDDMTRIKLLYCCHDTESILLRDELYSCHSYWNFSYQIYVSVIDTKSIKYNEPIVNCRLSPEIIDTILPFTPNDQFLICGSVEFNTHFKNILLSKNALSENIVSF